MQILKNAKILQGFDGGNWGEVNKHIPFGCQTVSTYIEVPTEEKAGTFVASCCLLTFRIRRSDLRCSKEKKLKLKLLVSFNINCC